MMTLLLHVSLNLSQVSDDMFRQTLAGLFGLQCHMCILQCEHMAFCQSLSKWFYHNLRTVSRQAFRAMRIPF